MTNNSAKDPTMPWWQTAEQFDFGEVHIKRLSDFQTFAFVAIHNTQRGPALGGCRFVHYDTADDGLYDAMRLARGMSYKAAMADLALGGGKAVIMRPTQTHDRVALFKEFGLFVDSLGGRYITAVDSGTNVHDMDVIATKTQHVASTSAGTGDPSAYTARGVLRGIEAAVAYRLAKSSLKNIHIAIQGVGNVGYFLAQSLFDLGARLTIADVNVQAAQRFGAKFNAQIVEPDKIFDVECDVFAPCALGGVLTVDSVNRLKTRIIAGGANNQLFEPGVGELLVKKEILYAPDYVINAGGLIQIAVKDESERIEKIDAIAGTLKTIFEIADNRNISTAAVADELAKARLSN